MAWSMMQDRIVEETEEVLIEFADMLDAYMDEAIERGVYRQQAVTMILSIIGDVFEKVGLPKKQGVEFIRFHLDR